MPIKKKQKKHVGVQYTIIKIITTLKQNYGLEVLRLWLDFQGGAGNNALENLNLRQSYYLVGPDFPPFPL